MSLVLTDTTQALYSKLHALLPNAVPWQLKAVVVFLVAFNAQSFPLLWHLRVMGPFWRYLFESRVLRVKHAQVSVEHPDPRTFKMTRNFRAYPTHCDVFGFHLSNSSYAAFADHLRGPYTYSLLEPFFRLPTSALALGSTAFAFKKEIPLMAAYTMTQEFIAHDKKWLYMITRFTSKSKSGAVTTHCLALSHIVLKFGRRTIQPARAFALSGFGPHGKENTAAVQKMSVKEQMKWLVGEGGDGAIVVGEVEFGMEGKDEWPGAL